MNAWPFGEEALDTENKRIVKRSVTAKKGRTSNGERGVRDFGFVSPCSTRNLCGDLDFESLLTHCRCKTRSL